MLSAQVRGVYSIFAEFSEFIKIYANKLDELKFKFGQVKIILL